jgi:hypothetical protein
VPDVGPAVRWVVEEVAAGGGIDRAAGGGLVGASGSGKKEREAESEDGDGGVKHCRPSGAQEERGEKR